MFVLANTRRPRLVAGTAALGLVISGWVGLAAAPSASAGTRPYDCGDQTWTVPAGVHYVNITAVGAAGHAGNDDPLAFTPHGGGVGGRGSKVSLNLVSVTPGQVLHYGVAADVLKGGQGSGQTGYETDRDPQDGDGGAGSYVATTGPDGNCSISPDNFILVAAGGGGGGEAASEGPGGTGGDADGGNGNPGGNNQYYAGGGGSSAAPDGAGQGGVGGVYKYGGCFCSVRAQAGGNGRQAGPVSSTYWTDAVGGAGGGISSYTDGLGNTHYIGGSSTDGGTGGGGGGGYFGGGGGGTDGGEFTDGYGAGGGGGGGGSSFPPQAAIANTTDPASVTITPRYDSTTTVTGSANPSPPGSSVTFTATVTTLDPTPLSGSVTFTDLGAGDGHGGGNASDAVTLATLPLQASGNTGTATLTAPALSVGPHTIVADYLGDGITRPSHGFVIQQVQSPQTITFSSERDDAYAGAPNYPITATATSGLPVTFSVDPASAGVCSLADPVTVSFDSPGTCTIDANQSGTDLIAAAPQVQQSIPVGPALLDNAQAITFTTTPPDPIVVDPTGFNTFYDVHAVGGGSGNPIVYTVQPGSACSYAGNPQFGWARIQIFNAGPCVVVANQADTPGSDGNVGYSAAPQVTQTLNVLAPTATVSFSPALPSSLSIGNAFTVNLQATSGQFVTTTVDATSSACVVVSTSQQTIAGINYSSAQVQATARGACLLDFGTGDGIDYAVTQQQETIDVLGNAQSPIDFTNDPTDTTLGATWTPITTAPDSGAPVVIGTSTPGTCTADGTTVTFTAVGTCTVTADSAASGNWAAAQQATRDLTVTKKPQAVGFATAPASTAAAGDSIRPELFGGGSREPVELGTSTPGTCAIDHGEVTFTAVGTCTLTVDQAGDDTYAAADQVSLDIAVGVGSQTVRLALSSSGPTVIGGSSGVVDVGGASSQPVLLGVATPATCTLTGPQTVQFTAAGTCTITGDQAGDANFDAGPQASLDVTVGQTAQAITFSLPASATVGDAETLSADGGASDDPVTFTVDASSTASACSLDGGTLHFEHAGTCTVDADQAGNADYSAAPQVRQSVTVALAASSAVLTLSPAATVFGQAATASVAVGSGAAGTVQFAVDGNAVGVSQTVSGGTATSPDLAGLAPGGHTVDATFTPADTGAYAPATAVPQTLTVAKAATTATLRVQPSAITAAIAVSAPGAGGPTGDVTFSVGGSAVGTAPLVGGTATLHYAVPPGRTRQISASYPGDSDFLSSSASTSRQDPTITAQLHSQRPASRYGWYRTPVTVTFACTARGASLVSRCPGPVTLASNGAGQSVSRTVSAADGGIATVTVNKINIDRISPSVRITGLTTTTPYLLQGPAGHCVGADTGSGLASCTITRDIRGDQETYTATAVDKAGNVGTGHVTVTVSSVVIAGASFADGAYTLRLGHTYTLVVAATIRPRYVDAAPAPRRPQGEDRYLLPRGRDLWVLGVTIGSGLRSHPYWNLGIRIGRTLKIVRIRVLR